MTRRYDSERFRHEVIRLRAVEAAVESVTDDVQRLAMDNALAQIETARIWVHRALRRLGPIRDLNEAAKAMDAAVRELTPTSVVSEPVVWDTETILAREG